jgi:two-component system, LuxR family, response regulator FixJ
MQNPNFQPTVFVVDDDADVRSAIAVLLSSSSLPIQLFQSAEDFLKVYDPQWPGCLLLDLQLPGMNGLDVQKILKQKNISLPVIIITGHGSIASSVESMKLDAVDFIEKPFRKDVLLESINKALQKDKHQRGFQTLFNVLSDREKEVMHLLAAGKSDKIVGLELGITQRGASFHRHNILKKMNVSSIIELVKIVDKA